MLAWQIYEAPPDAIANRLLGALGGHSVAQGVPGLYVVKVTYEGEREEINNKFQAICAESNFTSFAFLISPEIQPGFYMGVLPPDAWDGINKRSFPETRSEWSGAG